MIFSENRYPLFGIMLRAWSMIFSENRYPLFGIMLWISRSSGCRCSRHRNGSHIRNDGVDIGRLQIGLEGGHAGRSIIDVLAHDIVIPAAGGLVQRRTEGLGAGFGGEVADAAGLGKELTP